MSNSPFPVARNAVSNASRRPVSDFEIGTTLASGDGAGHVARALFSDCAATTLLAMARLTNLPLERLKEAYRTARAKHLAANDEMDELVDQHTHGAEAVADPIL